MSRPRIAVGIDAYFAWHERFAATLEREQQADNWFDFEAIDLQRHDWIQRLEAFDAVLWKSSAMGPIAAAHLKEKIYFLEHHLKKVVFPNFATVWHFESKVAQSYIFDRERVATPRTFVSFDVHDAKDSVGSWSLPLVFKRSHGAGSVHVRLVRTVSDAIAQIERTFADQLAHEARQQTRGGLINQIKLLRKAWMRSRVVDRLLDQERFRPIYWQEFVDGNAADLRITVIGGRYAVGFWRLNRTGDFRASGSGLIDYQRAVPEDVVRTCIDLSRRMKFDSMAYDILFKGGEPVVVEMSYGYLDEAVANAPGSFELDGDERLSFVKGGRWPQELWALSLLAALRVKST
jgi:glutathione synthase/RimK-type ligase-like ATP-grasp enzyme